MADEASLMFQVQNNDVDSEEEDEVIRKQELQKLLSEELQDDLLDSSDEEQYEEDNCTSDCESSHIFDPSLLQESNNVLPLTNNNDVPVKQISHVVYTDSSCGNSMTEPILRGPAGNQGLPVSPMNNAVDVFNGTSQEYSVLNDQTDQLNGSSDAVPVYTTTSEYSHLDRLHLEALHIAKSRQLKDMETDVKRIISENERKCGVLRHQVKLLEGQKQTMSDQMTKLQSDAEQLAVMVRDYQLREEQNEIVRREQQDLKEKLSSSQTTINLLTSQLNEMSSTDVLKKIRQNYESLIATSSNDHKRQLEDLQQSIATLEKELQEMRAENDRLVQGTTPDQDVSAKRERELEEDKRKLVAEVEDLTFQLNTVQEELSSYHERTDQLQQALCESEGVHKCTVEDMHRKEQELNDSLEKLQKELSSQKTTAEEHLKTSLEHCRNACLQLHEDSTQDLKRELYVEREKIEMQYKTEINRLRQMIGKEKEKSRKETEEALQEQIDTALSSAREIWKVDEEKRFQIHMQNILRQASRDQERKVADALKKKETDWAVKYRTLREEAERSRQKSEAHIVQLNKKLSKVLVDKSVGTNQKLVSELKSTLKSLQNALVQLISQTLICFEEEKIKQLKEVRQLALKEAEAHYLSCLHALVNKK